MDTMVRYIDPVALIEPLCKAVNLGNVRNRSMLLSKLTEILPRACDTKVSVVGKYVLPLAVELTSNSKKEAHTANKKMMKLLKSTIGADAIMEMASAMTRDKQAILKTIWEDA